MANSVSVGGTSAINPRVFRFRNFFLSSSFLPFFFGGGGGGFLWFQLIIENANLHTIVADLTLETTSKCSACMLSVQNTNK